MKEIRVINCIDCPFKSTIEPSGWFDLCSIDKKCRLVYSLGFKKKIIKLDDEKAWCPLHEGVVVKRIPKKEIILKLLKELKQSK